MVPFLQDIDLGLFTTLNELLGHSTLLDALVLFCAHYLPFIAILVAVALVYQTKRGLAEQVSLLGTALLAGIVARFVITDGIRALYHRPRPYLDHPIQHLLLVHSYSFPSAHAAFFFAFSAALYVHNKRWGIAFFGMSTVIGIARIIAGVHYPSDIAGGVVVGSITGYALAYFLKHDTGLGILRSAHGRTKARKK